VPHVNPYEPPQPTDEEPAALDAEHPRTLAWVLGLQVVVTVVTSVSACFKWDIESGELAAVLLSINVLAGLPLAALGGLLWLVEFLRLHKGQAAHLYLLLEPVVSIAWLWSMIVAAE
jgi:hypothetical protein